MKEYKERSILFSFSSSQIREECINIIAAYSKTKDDEQFSKIILTKYDSDYLNLEISRAIKELYYIVCNNNIAISNSLQSSANKESIGFETIKPTTKKGELACDPRSIELIDHLCEKIITEKTIIRWCQNSSVKDFEKILTNELSKQIETLLSYLLHLKKPSHSFCYQIN